METPFSFLLRVAHVVNAILLIPDCLLIPKNLVFSFVALFDFHVPLTGSTAAAEAATQSPN